MLCFAILKSLPKSASSFLLLQIFPARVPFMFHQLAFAEWRMKYIPRKSGSSRATRCISFFAFPPDPPCVLWPPASLPYHCFLVGCSRITLACAWHSTTYRLCGSPFGFSASLVPPAGAVGSPPASCTLCLLCYTWPPGASLATRK